MTKKSIVINMIGGPGTGKTVAAMELTARLKRLGYSAEYVPEAAKDLIHEQTTVLYRYQDWISAEQNRRQGRLVGLYDFIITDSPLILGIIYAPKNYYPSFTQLVREQYDSYNNLNIYLERCTQYDQIGRFQDEAEAIEVDSQLLRYLHDTGTSYSIVFAKGDVAGSIIDVLAHQGLIDHAD